MPPSPAARERPWLSGRGTSYRSTVTVDDDGLPATTDEGSWMTNVTFLGLGTMGSGMAGNLLQAGHEVRVWNRSPGKADDLQARGAVEVDDAHEAVAGAEV